MTTLPPRTVPWVVLGVALIVATAPAWRLLALGVDPTLDELLAILCPGRP